MRSGTAAAVRSHPRDADRGVRFAPEGGS